MFDYEWGMMGPEQGWFNPEEELGHFPIEDAVEEEDSPETTAVETQPVAEVSDTDGPAVAEPALVEEEPQPAPEAEPARPIRRQ